MLYLIHFINSFSIGFLVNVICYTQRETKMSLKNYNSFPQFSDRIVCLLVIRRIADDYALPASQYACREQTR